MFAEYVFKMSHLFKLSTTSPFYPYKSSIFWGMVLFSPFLTFNLTIGGKRTVPEAPNSQEITRNGDWVSGEMAVILRHEMDVVGNGWDMPWRYGAITWQPDRYATA